MKTTMKAAVLLVAVLALQFGADARRLQQMTATNTGNEMDQATNERLAALAPSLEQLGNQIDTLVAKQPANLQEAGALLGQISAKLQSSTAWTQALNLLGNASSNLSGVLGGGGMVVDDGSYEGDNWASDALPEEVAALNATALEDYINSFLAGLSTNLNVSSDSVDMAVGDVLAMLNSTEFDDLLAELEGLDFNSTAINDLRDFLAGSKQNIQDVVQGLLQGDLAKLVGALVTPDDSGATFLDELLAQLGNLNLTEVLPPASSDVGGIVGGCTILSGALKSLGGAFADMWDNTFSDLCAGVAPAPAPTMPSMPAPGPAPAVKLPADVQKIIALIQAAGPTTDLNLLGGQLFTALLVNFKAGDITKAQLSSAVGSLSADLTLGNEQLSDLFAGFINTFAKAPPADDPYVAAIITAITSSEGAPDINGIVPTLLPKLDPAAIPKLLRLAPNILG